MTLDTLTLPGSIPGLLRRGSLVLADLGLIAGPTPAVVLVPDMGCMEALVASQWFETQRVSRPLLALDLGDASARAHAAWWLRDAEWNASDLPRELQADAVFDAINLASEGEDMRAGMIDTLRRAALHAAKVAP